MVGPLSHQVADGGDRVEISLNGGEKPNIFMIEGEKPRLVLDFPESGYAGSSSVPVADGILVEGIRIGFHTTPKQKVRVVIDLVKEPKVKWTRSMTDRNLLVISIFPADRGSLPGGTVSSQAPPLPVAEPPPAEEPKSAPASVSPPPLLTAARSKVKIEPGLTGDLPQESAPATVAAAVDVPAVVATDVAAAVETEPTEVASEPPAAPPAAAPVLLSVSFDNAFSQSGEMVLLQLSDFQPPVISTREKDPPMIICDFAGAEVGEQVSSEISAGGKYVAKIRVAGEGSNVRVSLDLVPGTNYDLQQVYFKEDNLFVLIVNALDEKKG